MANPKHERLLKKGVPEWNQWRSKSVGIQPDLSNINLSGALLTGVVLSDAILTGALLSDAVLSDATLTGADLTGAILTGADLTGAILIEALLSHAILTGADLASALLTGADLTAAMLIRVMFIGADLTGADLTRANLIEADLTGVDLTGANLTQADLTGAILSGALLSGTIFSRTIFSSTYLSALDLRAAKRLPEIHHAGPSHADLPTIILPHDRSAFHFLRGIGLPDAWIDFYQSAMMHQIKSPSVFIRYVSVNEGIANRLSIDLQAHGIRCWLAPYDLQSASWFRQETENAIFGQEKQLLILSEQSIENLRIRDDVYRVLEREVKQQRMILLPICVDESVLFNRGDWTVALRSSRPIGNFTQWQERQGYQEAFTRLLKHLKD